MRILALDPATACGWAYDAGDSQSPLSGTWDLRVLRDESSGMRLVRFKRKLDEVRALGIDVITFEVASYVGKFMQGASVQSELQGVLKLYCEEHGLQFAGVNASTIKKHATGKGNAKKEAMVAAAKQRWPGVKDDNEADALWLLNYSQIRYRGDAKSIDEFEKKR